MKLHGKTALITGASKGLGRALALALAKRGTRVVLVARGAAELAAVADEVREDGGDAWVIAADVGDERAATEIAGRAAALAGGGPDIVIHNASTLGALPMPLLLDTRPEDLARVFEVNVLGPFRLTRALAGPMLINGGGAIVAISSDAAVSAYPGWGAYGSSKAAFDHLMRILAAELEGAGVQVVSVDPGEMDTQMHRDAMPDADPSTLQDPAEVAARIVGRLEGREVTS